MDAELEVNREQPAEATIAKGPEVGMTKKAMYEELMGAMSDIMKVLKARAEGKDPFPDSKKDAAGKGEKKEKVKRAPRAPSAYNNYMKGVQDMVKAKYPDLKQTELMKHIAAMWNQSEEKKISDAKRAALAEEAKKGKRTRRTKAEMALAKQEQDVKLGKVTGVVAEELEVVSASVVAPAPEGGEGEDGEPKKKKKKKKSKESLPAAE